MKKKIRDAFGILSNSTNQKFSIEEINSALAKNFSENLLKEFIKRAEKSKLDLPDLLISLSAVYNNCQETITFDKKVAKSNLFKLLK